MAAKDDRRAELEAELAKLDDDDDDDRPATFTKGDMSFSGALKDVRDFAASLGVAIRPAASPEKDDDKKPSNVKRFNTGRRTG